MSLSNSASCVKYTLFFLNFIFVITGIVILSVGLTVQGIYHGYSDFLDQQFFTLPTFLVVIGSLVFLIAFFGCFGAIKENYCMVLTFSILLLIVFILELSAGVTGYILRGSTYQLLTSTIQPTMQNYGNLEIHKNNTQITKAWDNVQETFACCGLSSYKDWDKVVGGVPISCCDIPHGVLDNFTCNGDASTLHERGCIVAFGDFIKAHAMSLALAGTVIAIIQLFGLLFSCFIARQIKKNNPY
ncbi:unnamed protein product [Diamesa serratosioi]